MVDQPVCRSAAMLDYLARHMRLASEAALTPLGLRPRHFVALTMIKIQIGIGERAQMFGFMHAASRFA